MKRVLQIYHIRGKPATIGVAKILIDRLGIVVNIDKTSLSRYLNEDLGAEKIGSHEKGVVSDFANCPLLNSSDYYHLDDLTLKVGAGVYIKKWIIEGDYRKFPQGVNLTVDLFGDGSESVRKDIKKNVFGEKNRKVIRE